MTARRNIDDSPLEQAIQRTPEYETVTFEIAACQFETLLRTWLAGMFHRESTLTKQLWKIRQKNHQCVRMSGTVARPLQTLRFRTMTVAINLSDLGDDDGVTADDFFHDVLDESDVVDPVFVAGLPATP